ncbi:MAG: type II toxin-antitoxin system HicB family antitoxin, partial [Actinobacteria bacterium]|nr:type II toxin-antitoxin system HicB family antitoxin [Actinomycetota bacterium]
LSKQLAAVHPKVTFKVSSTDHMGIIAMERCEPGTLVVVSESLTFTAVYEVVDGGWVHAHLPELPGVITAAPTRADAEVMLLDALREYLLSFTDPAAAGQRTDSRAESDTVEVTFSTPAA